MQQHPKHRRWIFSVVTVLVALIIATPVMADYIGPKRTVIETDDVCKVVLNECQYVEDKAEWKYKSQETWSCSLESEPWGVYSNQSRPCNDTLHTPGYQYWSREDVTQTETVVYPPATISGSLENCTRQNGWCITVPQLSMEGIEPVAGYRIFSIEGTLNGQNFACMSSSCTVTLEQGDNDFIFWALSTFPTLDSSEMGIFSAKVDSQLPDITSSMSGVQGSNGWYRGPATFKGSATDTTSGVERFVCKLDGVWLDACNTIRIEDDGPHSLHLVVVDNAGNTRDFILHPSIDSQNPTLNAFINGTVGANTWYTSATLNASATDASPGSGLSTFEYNLDSSGWIPFPASGTLDLPDGKHTVNLRAVDNAGRSVSSPRSFWLDTDAPRLNLDSAGTFGAAGWYITRPTLTASASDEISGLDIFEYSLDNSGWIAYTTPLTLSDGTHRFLIWAQDQAGLVTQVDRAYQVDTRAPQIAGSLSGIPGENGWFISEVTLSASASDPLPGSDLDTLSYNLNNGVETPYTAPVILADGQHTIQFHARDKAGLSSSIGQTFNVDTIAPSATIDTAFPNWIKGTFTINGAASDHGSGLASAELSLDGGQTWQTITGPNSWEVIWNTAASSNGIHEVHLRATDQAGLTTARTVNVGVDNLSPQISMPSSWLQWDTVKLNILDEHSGLSEAHVEISDSQGRWPTRTIQLDPGQFPLAFKWDRRLGDGTVAEAGTYTIQVFASDRLGNTVDQTGSIRVFLDILPPGPTSTPANTQPANTQIANTETPVLNTATPIVSSTGTIVSSTGTPAHTATQTASPTATGTGSLVTPTSSPKPTKITLVFGTIEPPAPATSTPETIPTPRATPTQATAVSLLESIFGAETTEETVTEIVSPVESGAPSTPTDNNVLWGTTATAAITAMTAYLEEERRKREEEAARLKALEEAQEERREKMKERKTEKMEAQRAQEAAWEQARQEEERLNNPIHTDIRIARLEEQEGLANSLRTAPPENNSAPSKPSGAELRAERKDGMIQEEINSYTAKPQEWKTAYENYMAQQALLAKQKEEEKAKEASSSQHKEKTWWQKALDWADEHQREIALTVGIGAGLAAVVFSGGLAIPAVLAVSGAMVAAGAVTASLTMGLNRYYERPWYQNLLQNVAIAGGTALVVSGLGLLYQAAAGGVSSYCAAHTSTCARVEPVLNAIDKVEETWLRAKLAYQNWRGDEIGAFETAFELQTEYVDGGTPGNAVFKELNEQFTHLSKNAIPIIQKYGDDVAPLLLKYGDEGIALIQKFGDDGIDLLRKYGNDATDLVVLDDDVLAYVMEQGSDAVEALSRWSKADLLAHGPELALRAKKDAEVLANIKKLTSLGPIDPKHLTEEQQALIEAIAANSTQYAEAGQVVLGKWVDNSSGFVQTAQATGSVHYNPHPDMWTTLGRLGEAKQEEVAWLINKQVVQNGIAKGLPFEYTLNGVPSKNIENEGKAVEAIFAGATNAEIMKLLGSKYMPVRMKELQELQKAGYKITFDDVNNSFILVPK